MLAANSWETLRLESSSTPLPEPKILHCSSTLTINTNNQPGIYSFTYYVIRQIIPKFESHFNSMKCFVLQWCAIKLLTLSQLLKFCAQQIFKMMSVLTDRMKIAVKEMKEFYKKMVKNIMLATIVLTCLPVYQI
jgi:hypothetical protein